MSILVTGGAGYIGSVVVDDLIDAGESVIVIDDLSNGNAHAVNSAAHFVEGDIGDTELVKTILLERSVTTVMHFAASANVAESIENPSAYYRNNTYKTLDLIDTMLEAGVTQLVFSSTCAVYGEPRYLPLDEKHPLDPVNPYGRSKLLVEEILRDHASARGLRSVSLRYFNACGATELRGEHHEPETHLIPLVLEAAAGKREVVSIYGDDYDTPDGTPIRDYIHVSDLSLAHILAAKYLADGHGSVSLNLGNGTGFSVHEIVEAARRITGRTIATQVEPRRAGDASRLVAEPAKAFTTLGWKPTESDLDTIIGTASQWRQANPNGYDK